jgi:sodium/hydrogen antiporter
MDYFSITLGLIGLLVILLGFGSKWLAQSFIPIPMLATIAGIIAGPQVLNLINLSDIGNENLILEKAARLTLGIGLVGVALRIPKEFPRMNWRAMLILLGAGMPLMWFISSSIIYFTIGTSVWMALLLGAIITPTDPIAASPIVTGKTAEENLPDRLRHTISFESGANDGLGYLFVFLPLLMFILSPENAAWHWLKKYFLYDVLVATVLGILLGYGAGMLLNFSEKRDLIKEEWRLVYAVGLGLFAVGLGRIIKSDEVLLVFAAAATFDQVLNSEDRSVEEKGNEAVNRLFSYPIFTLFGVSIPWDNWFNLGWAGIAAAVLILLFRRIPVLLLLHPFLKISYSLKDSLFLGWFGPVAVAALYYANLTQEQLQESLIWTFVSLMIFSSVIVHGLTSSPLTKLYGRINRRKVEDIKIIKS